MSYTGGCQCGAVRYEIAADSLKAYACHCTECQKQSASGFGISVPVFEVAFDLTGELHCWSRSTDSGSNTDCFFCPKCGSRLYHSGANRPGLITVKGGSLDNARDLQLAAHIWVKSKQDWLQLSDGLPQWKTQPQTNEEWMAILK
ncbi:MAG: GFA family protein [Pseudomonadota bacterium]